MGDSPTETIYVFLLNEGVEVWAPVPARRVGPLTFELLTPPDYNPLADEWEFPPGTIVRCAQRVVGARSFLAAVERISDQPAR